MLLVKNIDKVEGMKIHKTKVLEKKIIEENNT